MSADLGTASDEGGPDDQDAPDVSALLSSIDAAKPKRQIVTSACEACRRTKTKCDGQRPCARCSRAKRECIYNVNENETHQQAVKRRFGELSQSHNDLSELFQVIAHATENDAEDLVRQVRQGHSAGRILQQQKRIKAASQDPVPFDYEQRLRQEFLFALAASTAPLPTVVKLARSVLSPRSKYTLPQREAWEPLKHRIISLEDLSGILADSNSDLLAVAEHDNRRSTPDETYEDRIHWVPAAPWVSLSDEAFSHLISAFISISNMYWRIVEVDLFLKALRSKNLDSEYCSQFLVNAILALGSLFCEIDNAFTVPGDFLSRGEHFRTEATRLWSLEQGKASLPSVQGLAALSIVCGMRAQDRLGATFLSSAFTMNESLRRHTLEDDANGLRARRCLSETIRFIDCTVYALGTFRPSLTRLESFFSMTSLETLLPDTIRHWVPFPFEGVHVAVRANMLTIHRARLSRYACEATHLLFSRTGKSSALYLWQTAQPLAARIRDWFESLPSDFQYKREMPPWMFEFHGQYFCLMITIYSKCADAFLASEGALSSQTAREGLVGELYDALLPYAFRAANAARDFREAYGLKIIPPVFLQQCAVASFVLLGDMKRHPIDPGDVTDETSHPIDNSRVAFEECFRCLLGAGLQYLMPRAILRAIYSTAISMKVRLPKAVVQMLKVMGNSAWRASDIDQLNTDYPAWTLMREVDIRSDEDNMEDVLRKWEELRTLDPDLFQQTSDFEDSASPGGSSEG